jgi:hypothetical protein
VLKRLDFDYAERSLETGLIYSFLVFICSVMTPFAVAERAVFAGHAGVSYPEIATIINFKVCHL